MRTFLQRVLVRGVPAALVIGLLVYGFGRMMATTVNPENRETVDAIVIHITLTTAVVSFLLMATVEAVRLWLGGGKPKT